MAYKKLQGTYSFVGARLKTNDDSWWENRSLLVCRLFEDLSDFLWEQHGDRQIVLVEDYNQPLMAALGKEWQDDANMVYFRILEHVFKNNCCFSTGLLIGVHEFGLFFKESGLLGAKLISLTTGQCTARRTPPPDMAIERPGQFAGMFAFTAEDVEALVKKTRETSAAAGACSKKDIMDAITAWYGGYDFGYAAKRYNPHSVLKFLKKVADGASIENAAAPYWPHGGNMPSIKQLAQRRHNNILYRVPRLFQEYDTKAEKSYFRIDDHSDKAVIVIMAGDYHCPRIEWTTYHGSDTLPICTSEFVTILVHLGYLTIGPGNMLRIPNNEMRAIWAGALPDGAPLGQASAAQH
ncbi:hypothetical protein H4R19_002527 [Coemansia spiralis]|nr:hypothetical protein H4R19_002527 [Coemansia spiralis]